MSEKKKLTKLVLKKDVVSELSNDLQSRLRGGASPDGGGFWSGFERYLTGLNSHQEPGQCAGNYWMSNDSYCQCCPDDGGDGGYEGTNSCQPVESCVPMQCPDPEPDPGYGSILCPITSHINCYC